MKHEFDYYDPNEAYFDETEDSDMDDYELIERYYKKKKIMNFLKISTITILLVGFVTFSIVAYNTTASVNDVILQNDFDHFNPLDYF